MNKTVYLRDEEVPLWERARELTGDKLSPVIVSAVRQFVATREAEAKGFERIVVEFEDSEEFGLLKRKAFYGRWIISLEEPLNASNALGASFFASVAETAKGKVVILERKEMAGSRPEFTFRIFSSFLDAVSDSAFRYAAREAVTRRGVPVEELDI